MLLSKHSRGIQLPAECWASVLLVSLSIGSLQTFRQGPVGWFAKETRGRLILQSSIRAPMSRSDLVHPGAHDVSAYEKLTSKLVFVCLLLHSKVPPLLPYTPTGTEKVGSDLHLSARIRYVGCRRSLEFIAIINLSWLPSLLSASHI